MNGKKYRDVVTGFEGTCTGVVDYLTGCKQLLLVSQAEGGKSGEANWYDIDRCEEMDTAPVVLPRRTANGPDREAPKR